MKSIPSRLNEQIPFLDLQAPYLEQKEELLLASKRVLESGRYVLGEEVACFERNFLSLCGAKYAAGVNSGTSALHLALLALGIGPGDEVITVSHTFIATVSAIHYAGATPVLVDIDPKFYTIDPFKIEEKITFKTKAIIPVHLYGQSAPMDEICDIAKKHGLFVIEDAAQAHGATYKGEPVGSIGDIACFSFYAGKNLGACGEGGMVTTNNLELINKVKKLRDWGQEKKYYHDLIGYNYRMEAIQGALLDVKLRKMEDWNASRKKIAETYSDKLDTKKCFIPQVRNGNEHVYHIYNVMVRNRDEKRMLLDEIGIGTGIHYPIPVHLQKCYQFLGYREGDLPVTEDVSKNIVSLPMYPQLGMEKVDQIIQVCNEILDPY